MAIRAQVSALFNQFNQPGTNVRLLTYPHTGGATETAALACIAVTSGKSYAYGTYAITIANAAITADFWYAGTTLYTNVANDIYICGVGTGAPGSEVQIHSFDVVTTETTAVGETINWTAYIPIPMRCAANVAVSVRTAAASANARAAVAKTSVYLNLGG